MLNGLDRRKVAAPAFSVLMGLVGVGCGGPKHATNAIPRGGNPHAETIAAIRGSVRDAAEGGLFAGVVMVDLGDGTELFHSEGLAVREFDVPHGRDTRFKLHSLTKPLTSVVAHSLMADGLLAGSDSICDYLDSCPDEWRSVRVRHLLNHSSGLPELEEQWYSEWTGSLAETYLAMIESLDDVALQSTPGEEFRYSNGAYVLLSLVLENASGKAFGELLGCRVFSPARMRDAGLEQSPDLAVAGWYNGHVVVDRLANGYNGTPSEPRTAYSLMYTIPGAGGVYGSAEDLVRFARATFQGDLLPEDYLRRMTTPDPLVHERYARGWINQERHGHRSLGHSGGTNGFLSSLEHYPDLGITVVVLSNLGFADLRGLVSSIHEAVLSERD